MLVREAKPGDGEQMARVRVDTWRAAYRGIVPDQTLAELSYSTTEAFLRRVLWENHPGAFAYVAENDAGEVVGISVAGPVREREETVYQGQIYILYVLPDWQRHGLGRGLVRACAHGLVQRELTPIMLWTLANNPWRGFYDGLGGTVLRYREEVDHGMTLVEVAYGWLDSTLLCQLKTG